MEKEKKKKLVVGPTKRVELLDIFLKTDPFYGVAECIFGPTMQNLNQHTTCLSYNI